MSPSSTIAISIGDPAGIGPEITLKALADPAIRKLARWIVVGDRAALEKATSQTGIAIPSAVDLRDAGGLCGDFAMGQLSAACGRAAVEYVRQATQLCLDKEADAIVTGPLSKESVTMAGVPFTGHTEFIAELCRVDESRMLLINERLMVLHVTTHCSLRQACDVTTQRILTTLEIGSEALRMLGCERGRMGICGLNPHAGENGLFGNEDAEIIVPAIEAARARGIEVEGPLPADTAFLRAVRGEFDMMIAMYHDQGHIPMKLLDFDNTVNVSLGLPIIRTSVDHGTAFPIAGRDEANPRNMKAAIELACTLADARRSTVVS